MSVANARKRTRAHAPTKSVLSQADHPLLEWQLLLLKSGRLSFVLKRRNTEEHYGGYNLLQNTDLHLDISIKSSSEMLTLSFVAPIRICD